MAGTGLVRSSTKSIRPVSFTWSMTPIRDFFNQRSLTGHGGGREAGVQEAAVRQEIRRVELERDEAHRWGWNRGPLIGAARLEIMARRKGRCVAQHVAHVRVTGEDPEPAVRLRPCDRTRRAESAEGADRIGGKFRGVMIECDDWSLLAHRIPPSDPAISSDQPPPKLHGGEHESAGKSRRDRVPRTGAHSVGSDHPGIRPASWTGPDRRDRVELHL